jgi:hypothetical protein
VTANSVERSGDLLADHYGFRFRPSGSEQACKYHADVNDGIRTAYSVSYPVALQQILVNSSHFLFTGQSLGKAQTSGPETNAHNHFGIAHSFGGGHVFEVKSDGAIEVPAGGQGVSHPTFEHCQLADVAELLEDRKLLFGSDLERFVELAPRFEDVCDLALCNGD